MQKFEMLYVKKQVAIWLQRLMEYGVACDDKFLDCFDWCSNELETVLHRLAKNIQTVSKSKLSIQLQKKIKDLSDNPCCHRFSEDIYELVQNNPYVQDTLSKLIIEFLSNYKPCPINNKIFRNAKKKLQDIFCISDASYTLCEFLFINQSVTQVAQYFEHSLEFHKHANKRILTKILDLKTTELQSCFKELEYFMYSHSYRDSMELKDEFLEFWSFTSTIDIEKLFCRPLSSKTIPLEDFSLNQQDIKHVLKLLSKQNKTPVHILLYGPPGTGKTTFANSIAKNLGIKAWSVPSRDDDDNNDRRASLIACSSIIQKHKGAFILVDEAERLLDTDMFDRKTKDKTWLNTFLEKPNQRIIWITNHIWHIDQAVRRRFTYSIYFDELSPGEIKKVWHQVLNKHHANKHINNEKIDSLASKFKVSAAIIEQAVSQSKYLCKKPAEFYEALHRFLESYTTLQNNGTKKRCKIEARADYTLDGVCVEGSVYDIIHKSTKISELLRNSKDINTGCGTMLFYGPPGTGKTALARYIAKSINRECLIKRGSDLIDPFIGQTEKNIAEAFWQAEKDGAVLVIDEADTFIFSRDRSVRSWETGMVNEFLTALEECRCFCICTTNRRDDLDAAAMRRFSHKVAFTYAKQSQIQALYNKLLAPLCADPLPELLNKELLSMNKLTPGDFHVVCSAYNPLFESAENITHEKFIKALASEEFLKQEASSIGFIN